MRITPFGSPRLLVAVLLLAVAPLAPLAAQPVTPGELLGSTGNAGGSLITINPATGQGTLRCGLGAFGPVTEIEYRDDGVLFATTGGGSAALITIDPTDCTETLVGNHTGAVNGLEFVGSTLYGANLQASLGPGVAPEGSPTSLVTVDTTDGSVTSIGAMGFSPVRGLAWDSATQTMYGTGSALQGVDTLFTVNLADGATTPIGAHGVALGGLELSPDGTTLYGGERGGGGFAPDGTARLFSVSPANGVATDVGPSGFAAISGLTFAPAGPQPSVLEIPTLSGTMLLAFGCAILLAGWLALRRRSL